MDYTILERYLSPPRFGKFIALAGGCREHGWKEYKKNLQVSLSIYPRLHLFEVFLRNTVNVHLATSFNDPDWIMNQTGTNGFMSNASLNGTNNRGVPIPGARPYYLRGEVNKAIVKLGTNATTPKIIAEQNFGFWVALFQANHYRLLGGRLLSCFPNRPRNLDRENIHGALKRIKDFRNKVHHNEPVVGLVRGDYSRALSIADEIEKVCAWIDPELVKIIKIYPIDLTPPHTHTSLRLSESIRGVLMPTTT